MAKKQYEIAKKKKEEKERQRKERAAADAERRRAARTARKRDQEVSTTSEKEEDHAVDKIDRNQEESDGFESKSLRTNHNVKVCTTSPFFYFFLFNNFFLW